MELKEFKSLEENYSCAKSQSEEMRCEIDFLEKEFFVNHISPIQNIKAIVYKNDGE